jgi:acetyl-CoA carboxylase biotin carboxyl carrier protein
VDLKQIEKLMAAMEHSRIRRIALKREDFEIEIEREGTAPPLASPPYAPPPLYPPPPTPTEPKPQAALAPLSPSDRHETAGALYVTSPMVGTFYASPSPDDPPFVKIGDAVNEETVVCIIEAMKVMNEVKAGVKGIVSEILLKNGEPVEFGTHIFRVNPP